jgi:beta-glucosidase
MSDPTRRDFAKLAAAAGLGGTAEAGQPIPGKPAYYQFPSSFLWGCATASYQVEGAFDEDGKGRSVWDTFVRQPGRIEMDHTGDLAVDHYHRYKQDVQLMKWLGVKAYRFSIAWPRVFPDGYGQPNEKGVAFYERLVDELLANGIEPCPTLYHWDHPQALEDRVGGWRSRDTSRYLAEYAGYVSKRLSDRVSRFMTVNELFCFTDFSYALDVRPPGLRLPRREVFQIRHNALLGHGLAVQALRAGARRAIQVGIAENPQICVPVIETEPFLTAVLEGKYLDTYLAEMGADAPRYTADEMKTIADPLDFVGLNCYQPTYVRADPSSAGFAVVEPPSSYPRMASEWLYYGPQILYWAPRHMAEIWGVKKVFITENGCSAADHRARDGQIYDTDRVMFLRDYLIQAHRAVAEGWPLAGYFVWSLLDNFEWNAGYTKRFGIVYVNFETQERVPKLSAQFYRETIARGAVV